MCNFIEWQDKKVVYKRYASLFFIACVDKTDNELIVLEQIHLFVEVLDRYFGNVCELDIIFNFHKAYYILDELFIGGHLQETSKVNFEYDGVGAADTTCFGSRCSSRCGGRCGGRRTTPNQQHSFHMLLVFSPGWRIYLFCA